MSVLNDTTVNGRVTQTQDATDDQHLVTLKQAREIFNELFQGAWDSGTNYTPGQSVNSAGSFYVAKIANINKTPASNPTEWDLAAEGGDSAYVYIRYADDASGTGFSTSPTGKTFVAFKTTTTAIASPVVGDFAGLWVQFVSDAPTLDTDDVSEAGNLYFTEARVLGTDLAGFSATTGAITAGDTVLTAFNKTQGRLAAIEAWTTDNLTEGATNKYFSNTLARAAISISGAPLTYAAGVLGLNAASANTASYVVQRDSNGDFAARKITLGTSAAADHLTLGTSCTLGYTSSILTTNVPFKATKYHLSTTHDLRTSAGEMALYSITEAANVFATETGKLVVTSLKLTGLSGVLVATAGVVTGSADTDDLTEGATNLYFTNARADARADVRIAAVAGAANGLATLDSGGKLTSGQLPASVVGALNYQGTWNANTNSPTLVSSTGTKGYYYKVATAGTTTLDSISSWAVGDWVIFNGTTWDKIDNTDSVTSVNSYTGVITLVTDDIAEDGAPTNLWFTETRVRASVLTGFSATTGAISASDSILTAFNKTQGRLAAIEAWDTDDLTEGSTNLYFTEARVLGTDLAGFSATTGAITSSDTVLSAFNKTQGRLAAIEGQVRQTNVASVTAADAGGETSLLDTAAPSITANTLAAGNVIHFEAWGTASSAPDGTFRLKVGATVVNFTVTLATVWRIVGMVTVRNTGASADVYGAMQLLQDGVSQPFNLAAVTRNTTTSLTLDLTCSATGGDVVCTELRIAIR